MVRSIATDGNKILVCDDKMKECFHRFKNLKIPSKTHTPTVLNLTPKSILVYHHHDSIYISRDSFKITLNHNQWKEWNEK